MYKEYVGVKPTGYEVLIPEPKDNQQYFNIADYLPTSFKNQKIFLFITRRNVGKNYSTIKWLLENNKTFTILRRTKENLKKLKSDIDSNWIGLYGLIRKGDNIHHARWVEGGEETEGFYTHGEWIGNLTALSNVGNEAGGTSTGVDVIWFDEFIAHDRYLTDEQSKLISIVASLQRVNQNCILIGTSNAVALSAPLLSAFSFWNDELREWDESGQVIKFMFEEGCFNPIENEENSLAGLLAGTNEEMLKMNIKGQFMTANDRDKQMTPAKWYRDKSDLVPQFHFTVDIERKGANTLKASVFWSKNRRHYVVLDYKEDAPMLMYALGVSESIKSGNQTIGGMERANWMKDMLWNKKLFFTNYDTREAVVSFIRTNCTINQGGIYNG